MRAIMCYSVEGLLTRIESAKRKRENPSEHTDTENVSLSYDSSCNQGQG